jgi:SAM-dependent methyltransferase
MSTLACPNLALEAYESMAPYYDAFTAHHDYEDWTRSIERLGRQAGLQGDRLLDLGCGTGRSFEPWIARGWRVTGCDQSASMLARAELRAQGRAELHVADIRGFRSPESFDLVLMLDDVVNYLDDDASLEAAFVTAAAAMHDQSVLVFDANSLTTYRTFFSETHRSRSETASFVWEGKTSAGFAAGGRAQAHLTPYTPSRGGLRPMRPSVHVQRHHPSASIHAATTKAGLHIVCLAGMTADGLAHHNFDELRHTKALYIARTRA